MKKVKKYLRDTKDAFVDLINNEFKYLATLLSISMVCFIPVNYYIIVGGGISDISSRVKVEDGYKSKGSFNISYVTETDGIFLTYAMSYLIPNWKRIESEDYKLTEDEEASAVEFRNYLSLDESSSSAIKVSYEKAGKKIELVKRHIYVIGILASAKDCTLEVGDEILEIDGQERKMEEFGPYIASLKENDEITFKVIRNNKEKEVKTKVYREDENLMIGIYMQILNEYKTSPKANVQFKKSESGPSGGLMTALSIYNQLVKEDITKGRKIAGTGTIDEYGNVGSIGEVGYKVLGAAAGKAEIFLVPAGENYEDAMKVVKKEKLKIKVIPVETFDDAIEELTK